MFADRQRRIYTRLSSTRMLVYMARKRRYDDAEKRRRRRRPDDSSETRVRDKSPHFIRFIRDRFYGQVF